jgi:triacylglycerol esterase/lipase EstA (alpha/beta hydrolase family)
MIVRLRTRSSQWSGRALVAAAFLMATCLTAAGTAGATAVPPAPKYPVGTIGSALASYALSPGRVTGANDWNCVPTKRHPRPVVLVHGTLENAGFNWAALSPMLANAGYCVFAFNYGENNSSLGRFDGVGNVSASAWTMAAFVNKVLRATHAAKVDVVGHSQGGMMPNYYLKFLGGAAKVHRLVGLSPSNHGTTVDGLVTLGKALGTLGLVKTLYWDLNVPALAEQFEGSTFETALFRSGDTVPGVLYTVIQTTHDEVVTPYANAFLQGPRVRNITIQRQCPTDPVGHIGMSFDGPALQDVMNVLGPNDPDFRPVCSGFGIGL